MASTFETLTRPGAAADPRNPTRHRTAGLLLGLVGLGLAMIALVLGIVEGDLTRGGASASQLQVLGIWAFALTTAAFGAVKLGIGVVLLGIVRRIWLRVDAIKTALPGLTRARSDAQTVLGEYESAFGPADASATAPEPLLIHRMARLLWAPMLLMGAMLVALGLVAGYAAAGNVDIDPAVVRAGRAWMQGLQFLGEGALLSGISLLLGTILGAIRAGGGEVQESLGLTVQTLRMPASAKLFVALMMAGLMVEIVQFVLYASIATISDTTVYAATSTWLGPLREFGLGLLLSGIVLALATIARALGFQFGRVTEIITSGR